MAKNQEAAKQNDQNTNTSIAPLNTTPEIISGLSNNSEDKLSAALAGLESMDDANFVTVTGDYAEWKPGETHNIAVMSLSTMTVNNQTTGEPEEKTVVSFAERVDDGKGNKEVKNFIHGGAVLVSTVQKLMKKAEANNAPAFPMGLRVKITGEAKGQNNGKYLTMEIGQLFA